MTLIRGVSLANDLPDGKLPRLRSGGFENLSRELDLSTKKHKGSRRKRQCPDSNRSGPNFGFFMALCGEDSLSNALYELGPANLCKISGYVVILTKV
jgi:hypothetical protein